MKKVYVVCGIVVAICLYVFLTEPACVYGAEPRIENQGNTPMCTVYAVCNAVEYQMKLEGLETPKNGFDKKWLYDECKRIDGIKAEGTLVNYALQVAYEQGLKPVDNDDRYKITTYSGIETTLESTKQLLASGSAVILNSRVTMKDWKDGVITSKEQDMSLCHATYLVGYADDYLIGVNSWGRNYGFNGLYRIENEAYFFPNVVGSWIFEVTGQAITVTP